MSMKYVALLRGINVGGAKKVGMTDLVDVLEKNGFEKVKTLLNSGNVVFDCGETSVAEITKKLSEILAKKFGFEIPVIIRTMKEIERLIAEDPFKSVKITPDTRLYVTFLGNKMEHPKPSIDSEFFKILRVSESEICSVIVISDNKNTTDLMGSIEKTYGKNVTTRNWNTVVKIAALK